ncbi:PA3496 family putative envelope integrity protein [Pseudomonas sp. NPDC089752]|uniref:PA3496 family putative envelope integrity protein n=1 Tax=Pseudomonas sp. NPDC089752 TaxID=3364472 RepID=UPI0037F274C0
MARDFDGSYQPNAKARKQQEKDQRRMEYRRAIESYCDQRQLLRDLSDYPELQDLTVWQASAAISPKTAQQAR